MESISESSRMVLVHQFQDCGLPRSRRRLLPVTGKTCCLPTPLQSQIQVVGFCSEKDIRGTSSSPIPTTPYNFTVPSGPLSWSVATISVPSGKLSTEICGLGGGSLNSSCEAASTTNVLTNSVSSSRSPP